MPPIAFLCKIVGHRWEFRSMACTRCGITHHELYQRGQLPKDPLVAFNLGFDRGRENESAFRAAEMKQRVEEAHELGRQEVLAEVTARLNAQEREWRENEERLDREWREAQEPA